MLMKDYFIYKKEGMIDEYKKILHSEKHLFEANGGDKEALVFMFKLLKERNEQLTESIKTMSLELLLRERALSEISDSLKKEKNNI